MLIIGSHVSFKNDSQLVGSVKESIGYGFIQVLLRIL